ncbi:MAG: hypothetical protein ACI8QZ_000228 [Chlamydiales bacterium]|jgi:hypothetical protein
MRPNPQPREDAAPHPAAWRGAELTRRDDWELRLDPSCASELVHAVRATVHLQPHELNPSTFQLPRLGPLLKRLQDRLETGSGATILRNIPIRALAEIGVADAAERAFRGMARYIGTPVSQNAAGDRLLHVRDEHHSAGDPRVRGPNTSARLSFHTDRCDVIAFLCMAPAREGGETHLISSMTVHAELQRLHPDVLRVLEGSFPYLRHTVDSGNRRPFVELPIFAQHKGHFSGSFLRVLIDRAHAATNAPTLTPEQIAALDTLESVAEDPQLYASFSLAAGDALFINNWVTFHRRTAFLDHADPELRRHLLRLWLAVPNSRPLDPRFTDHFGSTEAGVVRGGMPAGSVPPSL